MTRNNRSVAINGIARAMKGQFSAGDVAQLRRTSPKDAPGSAFFKVAAAYLLGHLPESEPARTDAERRWAAILCGLAHLHALHRPRMELGRVLADAGYSEQRFVRLVRMNADQLLDELPRLARYLSVKHEPVDWADAARLMLTADGQGAEEVRRRLARGYFSKREKKDA